MTEATSVDRELAFQRERDELLTRQQSRRNSENEKLRDARLQAMEDEKEARAEAVREKAETALRAQLEVAFLANPAATESDFESVYPKLRAAHLAREATEGPLREKAALRRGSGNRYNF